MAIFVIPWPTTDVATARYRESQVQAVNVVSAVENFAAEYGRLPDPGRWWLEMEGAEAALLLRVLLGVEAPGASEQNPRQINFLSVREAAGKRNGVFYSDTDDLPRALYDAYGRPLRVALNLSGGDPFMVRYDGRDVALRGAMAAVWSVGKDGVEGTKDDVRSWSE